VGGVKGRGRETFSNLDDVDELVRLYDGKDNPIGKSYPRKQFRELLEPYFEIEQTYIHYFPARFLPLKLPKQIHRMFDKHLGFMMYVKVRKR